MPLNDDIDRLTGHKPRHPSVLGWIIAGVITVLGAHFCSVKGSPPVIGEVPRFKTSPDANVQDKETAPVQAPANAHKPEDLLCFEEPGPVTPPTQVGLLTVEPATLDERIAIYRQANSCHRMKGAKDPWKYVNPYLLLALYRLEPELGIPEAHRGILAASWCWEAGFRDKPRAGDEGRSYGPYQQQAWFWDWCGASAPTYDIVEASTCFWSRAEYYLADGQCPDNFARAEAMSANGVKYKNYGCKAESLHWKEWKRWQAQ